MSYRSFLAFCLSISQDQGLHIISLLQRPRAYEPGGGSKKGEIDELPHPLSMHLLSGATGNHLEEREEQTQSLPLENTNHLQKVASICKETRWSTGGHGLTVSEGDVQSPEW